jgi:hypothetical protein
VHPHRHTAHIVSLPAPLRLAGNIARHLTEAVVVPLGLFYGVVVGFGLHAALITALAWAYLAVAVRLARGKRPPAILLGATALSTLQVVISYAATSAMVYFLQPTLATYVFGAALLVTLPLERPLIQRLAHDFCPLPAEVVGSAPLRQFFRRLSLLWAAVLLVNASATLSLLLTMSTTQSVPLAAAVSIPAFVVGLALSYLWFRRSLREGGFLLTWG